MSLSKLAIVLGLSAAVFQSHVFAANDYSVSYVQPGISIQSKDGNNAITITGRMQFRYARPDDAQPVDLDDYLTDGDTEFGINRSRLGVKGNAFRSWLQFAASYDINSNTLLDYVFKVEKTEWLKFKVGQWKLEYSRERSISSGKQQMMGRSILNRYFTIDRHLAAEVYGHLDAGGMANFNYWTGVGTGTGRGEDSDDDDHPLYFTRFQWNFLGKEVPFSGSDVLISETPMASIGFGSAWNRSRYTRFSTSGGGALLGFEEGMDGQYSIKQHTVDASYFYAGFNGQGEYHEKEVTDRQSGEVRRLRGYYLQGGYFLHQWIPLWPRDLEVAARFARFTPDSSASSRHYEHALAFNWFISGHNNKITADVTRFNYEEDLIGAVDEWRYRLQWDISF